MNELLILLGLLSPDYSSAVAVQAALTIQTHPAVTVSECCGKCKGGKITHGDGHVTPCPCPSDCKCKAKGDLCESGTCAPRK